VRPPRYIGQPTVYGCGPTAIINVLKWAGQRATIRSHYRYLARLCQTNEEDSHEPYGTLARNLHRALNLVAKDRYTVSHKLFPKLGAIKKHLRSGGAIVLMHMTDRGRHFSLITRVGPVAGQDTLFEVVNAFSDMPVTTLAPESLIKHWILREEDVPQAWYITLKR
jgi:hypothetical protein